MSNTAIAATIIIVVLIPSIILLLITLLRQQRLNKAKEEFKTVRSEGTEARTFFFTGKYIAKATYFHPSTGVTTYKLYETPTGAYRIVYPNGNVSFKKDKDEIMNQYPKLARKAGLTQSVLLGD
jgi:hypothetical protein